MMYIIPLVLTIIIELAVLIILRFNNIKLLSWAIIVNIVTNPALNYVVQNNSFGFNEILLLELIVVITEAVILKLMVREKNVPYFRLSFIMNASSFLIGLYLPWELIERLY